MPGHGNLQGIVSIKIIGVLNGTCSYAGQVGKQYSAARGVGCITDAWIPLYFGSSDGTIIATEISPLVVNEGDFNPPSQLLSAAEIAARIKELEPKDSAY